MLEPPGNPSSVDLFVRNAVLAEDARRFLIDNDRSVARTTVPSRIDHRGVGDHSIEWNAHGRVSLADLGNQEGEDRVGRDNDVRTELVDQRFHSGSQFRKHRSHAFDDSTPAKQFKYHFPRARIVVDCRRVALLDELIDDGICAGVRIGHQDGDFVASFS